MEADHRIIALDGQPCFKIIESRQMRKDKQLKKLDIHDGVIAESKLITLRHLDFCRYLNKQAISSVLERRAIPKGTSYEIKKKDIVSKHVSSVGPEAGSEQA